MDTLNLKAPLITGKENHMNKYSQVPPLLLIRATKLLLQGRVHFPKERYGEIVKEDEEFEVIRKVVVDPKENQPQKPAAIFRVYFKFARFSPKTNKYLSLIPIPLIVAQPGFRSKPWLTGKDTGMFQGLYEWDTVEDAEHYWNSFPLKLMKGRSVPETLKYEIKEIADIK